MTGTLRWRVPAAAILAPVLAVVVSAGPAHAATVAVEWSMEVTGFSVVDPTSGAQVDLHGQWRDSGTGGVDFGYAGVPSYGVGSGDDGLSPGGDDFAVAATLRTGAVPIRHGYSPNVVQKGLAGQGGQWKVELHGSSDGTYADCRFEGTAGKKVLPDAYRSRLDDGQAHTVLCWRTGPSIGITVDGRTTTDGTPIGVVDIRGPVTMANKSAKGTAKDQFTGSLDCVVMTLGVDAQHEAASRAGC